MQFIENFDDQIIGTENDEEIYGGAGNDELAGEEGNDVYKFNIGDGSDIIFDYSGKIDKIFFGAGVTLSHLKFYSKPDEQSLIIKVEDGKNGQIKIENFFTTSNQGGARRIEFIEFHDGSKFYLANLILKNFNVNYQDIGFLELLVADNNDNLVIADNGNNNIIANAGNDNINAKKGNDYIDGGAGDDIYYFNLGDGIDIIVDDSGIDKIIFGNGINKDNIKLISNLEDNFSLIIKIGNNGDNITINNFFNLNNSNNNGKIELLQFADGSTLSLINDLKLSNEILSKSTIIVADTNIGQNINGSDFNDEIFAGSGNDIIDGKAGSDKIIADSNINSNINNNNQAGNDIIKGGQGDDYIDGGAGDDIYYFNLDDGADVVVDASGIDKIIFGEGINKNNIDIYSLMDSYSSLVIRINDNDKITIKNFFSAKISDKIGRIEVLEFADGSTVDLTTDNSDFLSSQSASGGSSTLVWQIARN